MLLSETRPAHSVNRCICMFRDVASLRGPDEHYYGHTAIFVHHGNKFMMAERASFESKHNTLRYVLACLHSPFRGRLYKNKTERENHLLHGQHTPQRGYISVLAIYRRVLYTRVGCGNKSIAIENSRGPTCSDVANAILQKKCLPGRILTRRREAGSGSIFLQQITVLTTRQRL